jgi:hypothetical protein
MSEPGSTPKHPLSAREFWTKYLLGTLVVVLLLASGFSQQGGFELAAPTFGDYWVGVPLLLIGGFLFVGGVSSRSWIVALMGTFLVVGAAGLLLLVATPDTSGTATTPGYHTAAS